jgi:fatty acid desaturase
MAWMENHLDGVGGSPEPQPEPRHKLSAREIVLGTIVAVLFAAVAVVAAILSFDLNPAGPVVVVVAAITAGSLSMRRVHDTALKAAAIGLVVGGVAAILFWPFFGVD